jgi:hypothetical protein
MKAYWRNGGIAPRIGNKWRRVVSFTPWLLYPHGKCPWYPLDRRLGGLQNRSGCGGEEKSFPAPAGTRTPDHSARSPALYHWAIPTSRRGSISGVYNKFLYISQFIHVIDTDTYARSLLSFFSLYITQWSFDKSIFLGYI